MRRILAGCGALLVAFMASAAIANSVYGSTNTSLTISSVQPMDYDDIAPGGSGTAKIFINLSATPTGLTGIACNSTTWRVGGTSDNIKNILAVATAAKLAGRSVTVYWSNGANSACDSSGYPIMAGIAMQ
jgi:hypothetical protein